MSKSSKSTSKSTTKALKRANLLNNNKINKITKELKKQSIKKTQLEHDLKQIQTLEKAHPEKISKKEINEDLFVSYYLSMDCNGTRTIMKLRPDVSYGTAHVMATRLLQNVSVKAKIKKYVADVLGEDKEILKAKILNLWRNRAFYTVEDFINNKGGLKKELKDLTPDQQMVIENIKTSVHVSARGHTVTNVTLADRDKAVDKLAKYIKLIDGDESVIQLKMTDEVANNLHNIFRKKDKVS